MLSAAGQPPAGHSFNVERDVYMVKEFGEVAERSNATDCKSVALVASEVRILPSPPCFWGFDEDIR